MDERAWEGETNWWTLYGFVEARLTRAQRAFFFQACLRTIKQYQQDGINGVWKEVLWGATRDMLVDSEVEISQRAILSRILSTLRRVPLNAPETRHWADYLRDIWGPYRANEITAGTILSVNSLGNLQPATWGGVPVGVAMGEPDSDGRAMVATTSYGPVVEATVLSQNEPDITIEPAWLAWNDRCIPRLAQQAYDTDDFSLVPIIADALEDAGADDAGILGHLRANKPHCRGCWVLEALLEERV